MLINLLFTFLDKTLFRWLVLLLCWQGLCSLSRTLPCSQWIGVKLRGVGGKAIEAVVGEQFEDLLCVARSQYSTFNTVYYIVPVAVYLLNQNDDRPVHLLAQSEKGDVKF